MSIFKEADIRKALEVIRLGQLLLRQLEDVCTHPFTLNQQRHLGEVVQGYKIFERIAQGAQANIFLGKRIEDKKSVAIKLPRLDHSVSLDFNVFLAEILPVTHNIDGCVEILDIIFNSRLRVYGIVMELVTDPTLEKSFIDRTFTTAEACRLTVNMCNVVEKIHEKNILHRDLKPANIFISENEETKIMDFGLAIKMTDGIVLDTHGVGTPDYMAPEQYPTSTFTTYGVSADIYAIGTIFYKLLCRRLPFEGTGAREKIRRKNEEGPQYISFVNEHIPAGIEKVVMKSINRSPGLRQQSAKELADEIRSAALEAGLEI